VTDTEREEDRDPGTETQIEGTGAPSDRGRDAERGDWGPSDGGAET
jgi:hypothetical protein